MFPVRYELNFYIRLGRNSVLKWLRNNTQPIRKFSAFMEPEGSLRCLPEIHFNSIIPSSPLSTSWSPHFRFFSPITSKHIYPRVDQSRVAGKGKAIPVTGREGQ
jgi:hypothetical protein